MTNLCTATLFRTLLGMTKAILTNLTANHLCGYVWIGIILCRQWLQLTSTYEYKMGTPRHLIQVSLNNYTPLSLHCSSVDFYSDYIANTLHTLPTLPQTQHNNIMSEIKARPVSHTVRVNYTGEAGEPVCSL